MTVSELIEKLKLLPQDASVGAASLEYPYLIPIGDADYELNAWTKRGFHLPKEQENQDPMVMLYETT